MSVSEKQRRSRQNRLNLFITCSVLLLTFALADGNFTQRINEIGKSLDRAIFRMLELEQTNYTEFEANVTYYSSTHFNPKGMGGLYNLTTLFMRLLQPEGELYPKGFLDVEEDGQIYINYDDWKSLLVYYVGLLVIVAILVLFAVFMPFCGLCFCCCRCCGNCGARSKPFDKKGDLCRKFVLATLLIGLGTLLLFGVVCAFVSNQHMQDGTEELTANLNTSITDAKTYLNTTGKHIDTILTVNYDEFETSTFRILNQTSDIVFEQLKNYSHAVSMTQITNIVESLPRIQENLQSLKKSTNDLRVNASQLNDALRKVKREMLGTLNQCLEMSNECQRLYTNITTLGSDIDFDNLPDISDSTDSLEAILESNIQESVEAGKNKLEQIRVQIENTVNTHLDEVKSAISKAGFAVKNASVQVNDVLRNLGNAIDTGRDRYLVDLDGYINKYSPYRYYVGVGISCVLLFVTLCIALGLICGICGKRPDAYGDDCCNKGAGSRFLMCGIMVMFFSAFFFAVITIAYFVIGVVLQRAVCESFRNPTESQLLKVADEVIDLNKTAGVDAHLPEILSNCHQNQSIYNVLHLKNVFDLSKVDNYLEEYDIQEQLNKLADVIDANFNDFEILDETAIDKLKELQNTKLDDIKFYQFTDVLTDNFTTVSLNLLVDDINKLIDLLENRSDFAEIVASLRLNVMHLTTYQERIVEPMTEGAKNMVNTAKETQEALKFNYGSFSEAIEALIVEVQEAQTNLKEDGPDMLKDIAGNFTAHLVEHTKVYLDRVVETTNTSIGRCGPLSRIVNATLISTCDKVLLPWNGFWFGLFWSLILFIPTIIVSVKLATLYQKYNPYTGGHLMETEVLYDMYADREHIPLNSGRGGKKKKHKKNRREDRNIPGAAHHGAVDPEAAVARRGEFPVGAHPQDTRYADMAPKHWEEFPANGPPQYQRAPTEYERPPPYYYPGSGDEH